MEKLVQLTYTVTPPLTCDSGRERPTRATGRERRRASLRGMAQEAYTWTQGGYQQFFNKLHKPGLELETIPCHQEHNTQVGAAHKPPHAAHH